MGDTPVLNGTPNSCHYELRTRTPGTPNTPLTPSRRVLRSTSTPVTADNVPKELSTPRKANNLQCTPVQRVTRSQSTPKSEEKQVFRTPMSFKPRLLGNKPVPSPSRTEIWKQQLGLADEASGSDKENSSSEDEENQQCQASLVEYRALQKELAAKNAQRDESLLFIKNCKDKIRHYKSRLEREETNKRQQLKILRKTHECQIQEKEKLVDNLQAIITELEERIRELEEASVSTPRKRNTRQVRHTPSENIAKLVDDIKRLHGENSTLTSQLNEVQLELYTLREDGNKDVECLKEAVTFEKSEALSFSTVTTPCDQLSSQKNNYSLRNDQSLTMAASSTDTEKQVEVLLAENKQLLHDLNEARNNHTKALTVTKLNNHRQQQLEEELKRVKQRCVQLEEEVTMKSRKSDDLDKVKIEVTSLTEENTRLQASTRELQAQIFTLQAKSPEVVKKQVESESLKKKYESSKTEIQQLKLTCDTHKDELHKAQNHIRYLERMLKVTEAEKEKADSSLWQELESLNTEHQASYVQLKDNLEKQKLEAVNMCESRLAVEHKKEMQILVESLNTKHKEEIKVFEGNHTAIKIKYETELSKLEEEKVQQISKLEIECDKTKEELKNELTKFESEKSELERVCKVKCDQIEEDLMIAKTAAVNRVREEMNKEMQDSLEALEERLKHEHSENVVQIKDTFARELQEAIEQERQTTADKMAYLEKKYSQLVTQLTTLQPVLDHFVQSYIRLQKEVKHFPKMINKTVNSVTKQVTSAITGISEYNQQLVKQYHKEMKLRKKYHNELVELKGNIRVFCRVRPMIKEDGGGQQAENIVSLDQDDSGVLYVKSKGRTMAFEVDRVFGEASSQTEVFDETKALVTSCIDGYNVCIFAYGQTGSGKTYTMEGTPEEPGINQRALGLLFAETATRVDWEYTITVSVLEIYNDMIRDLLGDDTSYKMEVKMNPDGGYHIPGLCFVHVRTVADVNECFQLGQQNRATAATNMNEHSSRSHCLLCVTVVGFNKTTATKTSGKLNLVDLAGSERVSKSKADGERLKEAKCINTSLSALGNVISALRSKQSHVPYRNSKLTYLLQDSLGGDSKTLMITQIAPVRKNEGETICSLNFSQRVRNVELGAATQKLENGDGTDNDPSSPARNCSTPQRGYIQMGKSSTPSTGGNIKSGAGTPSGVGMKTGTPSSSSKLTPVRQARKKTEKF